MRARDGGGVQMCMCMGPRTVVAKCRCLERARVLGVLRRQNVCRMMRQTSVPYPLPPPAMRRDESTEVATPLHVRVRDEVEHP